ncbi:TetR/AcrR family transcriptional regulator [Microbacterium excoecariae]|uniref:TetR/AcrR family transcriptional regulator n=1 Tax=Microbacterium excoecariae TaxID=2715210 RepID=UPI0030B87A0B
MSDERTPPAMNPPKMRGREATKARLLDAAAAVFAEVGLGSASVEAVCERAGFTRGAFYSNFASKEELFLELARRGAHDALAAVHARAAAVQGPFDLDDMDTLVRLLGAAGEDAFTVQLTAEITAQAMRDERLGAMLAEWNAGMTREIAQIVEQILISGGLRLRVPALEATRIILAVWSDVSERVVVERLGEAESTRVRADAVAGVVRLLVEV